MLGKTSWKGLSSVGTGEQSGGAGLIAGLDDVTGLSNLNNSMIF